MFDATRVLASAVVCLLLNFSCAVADDQSAFQTLLNTHSYSIEFQDGELRGPGADLILKDAAHAQFVALGEEHYNAIIPDITTALFSSLHERYGYDFFMTEQDPVMMETISSGPARGDLKKIQTLAQSYPMGFTFNSDEELQMLADIGRISAASEDAIWGCDQASGVTHILDELQAELTDPSARSAVDTLRLQSAEQEAVRDYSTGHYISDTSTETFTKLKSEVNAAKDSRASWLIDTIINSNRIFTFYHNGSNNILPGYYENNRFREEHLKDLCLAKYRAAEKTERFPKALMKFGSWHLFEGLSPTRIHTIGDFFSNIARFNGSDFLSIYFVSRPENPEESMKDYGFIWPFISDLDPGELALVDLREFRRYPNRALVEKAAGDEWKKLYKEDFVRLVYGYDMIFFVGTARSASFETVPPPD